MALTVIVRSGELSTPPSISFDAPRIVIGRGDGCEVRLPDPSVSHRHASIRQRGTDYVVMDEGSTNGTFVGPVRLSPQAPRIVRSGDLVRIGRVWLELRIEQVPVSPATKLATSEIALALVARALEAQGDPATARVFVQSGPDKNTELLLDQNERPRVIGRGSDIDLTLDDARLSRKQVELRRRGTDVLVRDLGSKNGSFLNGQRLESGKDVPWPAGAVLAIGASELCYEDPLRSALLQLEAAPDEHMRAEDPVDPPVGQPSQQAEAPVESAAAPPRVPERAPSRPPRSTSNGLRPLDLLVALIAVSVFVMSLVGIWWLFR